MEDLAQRMKNKIQLSTDGLTYYISAVDFAFNGDVDYAQIKKTYGKAESDDYYERKYSPAVCTGMTKNIISGNPAPELISTSYVERQNLTMRMHMRRFTRLTNAFSKKFENHSYAVALHFVYYNFCKVHKTLRVTPAMASKLAAKPMSIEDIIRITYAHETEEKNKLLARKNRGI